MPRLTPLLNEPFEEPEPIVPAAISTLVEKATPQNTLQTLLNNEGASLKDIARTVSTVMNYGKNDSSRLLACKFAAEVHEAHTEKASAGVSFNFLGDNNNVNILQILNPRR